MPVHSIKTISADNTIGIWEMSEPWQGLENQAGLDAEDLQPLYLLEKDKRKTEWLACRVLIREMLGIAPVIHHDENRKPHLKDDDHFLSMSHSGAFACVYLGKKGSVGIDIQQMKPSISKGMDYFLKEEEQEWINADNNTMLHLIWSSKESAFKYAGDPNLDLKKHISVNAFSGNQNGTFEVVIQTTAGSEKISIGYETFDDYVLTWTL